MSTHANKTPRNLFFSDDGATAVEYAMMIGLIFLAALLAVTTFGQAASANFAQSASELDAKLNN